MCAAPKQKLTNVKYKALLFTPMCGQPTLFVKAPVLYVMSHGRDHCLINFPKELFTICGESREFRDTQSRESPAFDARRQKNIHAKQTKHIGQMPSKSSFAQRYLSNRTHACASGGFIFLNLQGQTPKTFITKHI